MRIVGRTDRRMLRDEARDRIVGLADARADFRLGASPQRGILGQLHNRRRSA